MINSCKYNVYLTKSKIKRFLFKKIHLDSCFCRNNDMGGDAFQFFAVDVLRTTPCIRRIHAIDIVSLREIPTIARRAFISIEQFVHPNPLARRAFISIEQFVHPKPLPVGHSYQ